MFTNIFRDLCLSSSWLTLRVCSSLFGQCKTESVLDLGENVTPEEME